MRTQFVSGTHAIATALFAVLRPGDELLAVAGKPYDTLEEVIGLRGTPGHGSLKEWGVSYRELLLTADGSIDFERLPEALNPSVHLFTIPLSNQQVLSLMHVLLPDIDLLHAHWQTCIDLQCIRKFWQAACIYIAVGAPAVY